jgi:hypothetical protein
VRTQINAYGSDGDEHVRTRTQWTYVRRRTYQRGSKVSQSRVVKVIRRGDRGGMGVAMVLDRGRPRLRRREFKVLVVVVVVVAVSLQVASGGRGRPPYVGDLGAAS